jgi:type II secretory pathway component GspD/PulD (secretin)
MKRKWIIGVAVLQLVIFLQAATAAQKLIDLEFKEARIQDVLQVLRRLGDFNIVADPQVTGEVTVYLKRVTVREAVGLVAQAAGYSYHFEGNTVHIASEQRLGALFAPSALPTFEPVRKVYNLQNADAAQAVAMLSRMLPGVNAVADASRNLVVLSAGPDQLRKAEALLLDYDSRKVSSRPLQNVDVIKLNHADPAALVNVIRAIEPNATVTVDAFTRSLVVYGSQGTIASVRSLIPMLDTIQRQVLVDARLVEVSVESLNRLGLTWDLPNFALSLKRGASLSMTSEELGGALEALISEGSARILANPKIAAVNATPATFLIGDRIPILMNQADDLGRVTGFLEFIEAGIKLAITPIIGDDGFVTMEIKTGVSGITGMTPQNIPQIRTREVTTKVRVRDGQPLVIGGLIQEEDRVTESGLPILQNFPLVGELFRRKQNQKVQSETVIFLTPHVVAADAQSTASVPAQRSTTEPPSTPAVISSEARGKRSVGGDPLTASPGGAPLAASAASASVAAPAPTLSKAGVAVEPTVATPLEPSSAPAPGSTAAPKDQGKAPKPAPAQPARPVEPSHMSISIDMVSLADSTVDLELESGAEIKFLTRLYIKPGKEAMTWGFGLGLRRSLVGPLWADIAGEQIMGPDSLGTALAASAQLGIRLPLKWVFLDSYAGYRQALRTGVSGTLLGRTEGAYGGVRLGW